MILRRPVGKLPRAVTVAPKRRVPGAERESLACSVPHEPLLLLSRGPDLKFKVMTTMMINPAAATTWARTNGNPRLSSRSFRVHQAFG
eukprot:746115-Hanusia_phi.AAC.6